MAIVTKEILEELAAEGMTQADAARWLNVSRSMVNRVALDEEVVFKRREASRVEIECPRCKVTRSLTPGDAKRRKTDYCFKCSIVSLGVHKQGTEASPVTKKRSKPREIISTIFGS